LQTAQAFRVGSTISINSSRSRVLEGFFQVLDALIQKIDDSGFTRVLDFFQAGNCDCTGKLFPIVSSSVKYFLWGSIEYFISYVIAAFLITASACRHTAQTISSLSGRALVGGLPALLSR
jgi:hypothetical protein